MKQRTKAQIIDAIKKHGPLSLCQDLGIDTKRQPNNHHLAKGDIVSTAIAPIPRPTVMFLVAGTAKPSNVELVLLVIAEVVPVRLTSNTAERTRIWPDNCPGLYCSIKRRLSRDLVPVCFPVFFCVSLDVVYVFGIMRSFLFGDVFHVLLPVFRPTFPALIGNSVVSCFVFIEAINGFCLSAFCTLFHGNSCPPCFNNKPFHQWNSTAVSVASATAFDRSVHKNNLPPPG